MTTGLNFLSHSQTPQIKMSRLLWVVPLAILISTVANLGLYVAAGNLFPQELAWSGVSSGQIIGANIVYLLFGAIVFVIVNRRSSQPNRHYWIVATIGLILSFWLPISAGLGFGPPEMSPAPLMTVVTLCLMHVLSYIITVPLFTRLVQES